MAAELRIALLGKTGTGKTSFVNSMFGETVFQTDCTANSETRKCQMKTEEIYGRKITMIDTPGLFDTYTCKNRDSDITECVTMCSPGLHAFLIFLKVEKFTEHENQVITKIKKLFSEEAFKYAVVVFTHGDQLDEGMTIEKFASRNPNLNDLLQKCGGRCCVVDNKYWVNNPQDQYRNNQVQVKNLLSIINKMMEENNYRMYTNKMLQMVDGWRTRAMKKLKELLPNWTWEDIKKKAREIVSKLLKQLNVVAEDLFSALFARREMSNNVTRQFGESQQQITELLESNVREAVSLTLSVAAVDDGAAEEENISCLETDSMFGESVG